MSQKQLRDSLDWLKSGQYQTGEDWRKAHEICQQHEGEALFDWVHALAHRIEGDDANADYWYRRAGRTRHPGTIEEEWQIMRSAAEAS